MCDLELLLCGGLSPLRGFMDRNTYESVLDTLRLPDGTLWSIPITLDVSPTQAEKIEPGQQLALRDDEGFMLAVLTVADKWQPDRQHEASEIYGTTSTRHLRRVSRLFNSITRVWRAGELDLPTRHTS